MGKAGLVLLLLLGSAPAWAQAPITAMCAGGFTGGGGGMRITPDGTVSRIRQTLAEGQRAEAVGSDPEAYRRWNAALDVAGFDRMAGGAPGNITCRLTRGPTTLRWGSPDIPPGLPAPFAQVFRELRGWVP